MSWLDPPPLVDKPFPPKTDKPKRYGLFLVIGSLFWVAGVQVLWWIIVFFFHAPWPWAVASLLAILSGCLGAARTHHRLLSLHLLGKSAGWSASAKGDKM